MADVVYTVFETNADQEEVRKVIETVSFDIAEAKMTEEFKVTGFEKDFMILAKTEDQVFLIAGIVSMKTASQRGECQS